MHTAWKLLSAMASCAVLIVSTAFAENSATATAQDKYSLSVPGGLAFSEFKGYEGWQAVAVSHNERAIAVILANSVMIDAYKAGMPANGKAVR